MKITRIILTTFTGIALCVGSASAQQFPSRPVFEAAQKAPATQRVEAFRHLQNAYPDVAKDMYGQLKAKYPNLEHQLVDSVVAAWEQNPGHLLKLATKIEEQHGEQLLALRRDIREELESSYPNFRPRLKTVLEEKGLQPRWLAFLNEYDSGLLPEVKATLVQENPAWQNWKPGMFRERFLDEAPGSRPLLKFARRMFEEDPSRGPRLAKKVLEVVRNRAPGLAEDYAVQWIDQRRELVEALQAEFPGAGMKIARVVEAKHPQLRADIQKLVEAEGQPLRASLRREINTRMPGFEETALTTLDSRYPNLRTELLGILKG